MWTLVFDGYTPITEARIDYFTEGQAVQSVSIESPTPTSFILRNLMPYMTYNITVFYTNEVGTSDLSIQVTLSLGNSAVTVVSPPIFYEHYKISMNKALG